MKKINEMPIEDIKKTIAESRGTLRELRFGASGAKSNNVKHARTLRREIARMMTELRARTQK